MDYLNLAAGIGGSVVSGFDTYNKFKPQFPTTGGGSSLKIGGTGYTFNPSQFEAGMNSGYSYDY